MAGRLKMRIKTKAFLQLSTTARTFRPDRAPIYFALVYALLKLSLRLPPVYHSLLIFCPSCIVFNCLGDEKFDLSCPYAFANLFNTVVISSNNPYEVFEVIITIMDNNKAV